MRVGTYDMTRRSKFKKILNEVRENPTKEAVQTNLISTETGDLIEKCNWKLRKAMIRKVNEMAAEFDVDVADGFGVPLNHKDMEAKLREEGVARTAEKKAKLDEAVKAQKQRIEKKAAKKAERVAAIAENLKKIKNSSPCKTEEKASEAPAAEAPAAEAPAAEAPAAEAPAAEAPAAEAPAPVAEEKPTGGEVSVSMIKELREATGAGMMDCKKALIENGGDAEAASEYLRKKGLAQADKKAARVAAEGRISVASKDGKAVMVEINCETDFVAKDGSFLSFGDSVANAALDVGNEDTDALASTDIDGSTVEETRQALVSKIGENIQVRRFVGRGGSDSTVGSYVHMNRIGVLVEIEGGSTGLAEDIAMHVAAMNPPFAVPDEVPGDVLEKERNILKAQALESGKPAEIVDKMVEGRIRKYLEEICLVSQTYVKTNDKTVGKLLEENGAKMVGFTRIEVGEGIEKKEDNFAEEVAAMAAGKA